MPNQDRTGKAVLAGLRRVFVDVSRHANIRRPLEPEDVEGATAIPQLAKEALNGMNGMQELESIWSCGTVSRSGR